MNLTKQLKEHAVSQLSVEESADEDAFKAAIGSALASGTLSVDKFTALSTEEGAEEADEFSTFLKQLSDKVDRLGAALEERGQRSEDRGQRSEDKGQRSDASAEGGQRTTDNGQRTKRQPSRLEKMIIAAGGFSEIGSDGDEEGSSSARDFSVRVKEAAEQYDSTKRALVYPKHTEKGRPHPLAGEPVKNFGEGDSRVIDEPSELGKAVNGSVAKFLCATAHKGSRMLAWMSLPQHDKELVCYAMENMKWCGASDGGDLADIKDRKLTPHEQKSLIDDTQSGGIEAVPIVFDDDVITTPLLHSELLWGVNMVPLDRGRRVEGVITGHVTGGWGGYDDQAVDLFDTTAYVQPFDTTIHRWEGAIRIGLDFLSDSPIDFGAHVTGQYGERLLEDLDNVIATGSGMNEPEGVMAKSGVPSISFGGNTTIGNYESLRFGVPKAEHRSNLVRTAVFCGTETSYQRMKAIPVGAADDRRLFGQGNFGTQGQDDYSMMHRRYAINESMTNREIFYAILGRYRMYRRRGFFLRTTQQGDFLVRRNQILIVAMARYGGQLERPAVAARTTNAPA